jgi:hypothetical protein
LEDTYGRNKTATTSFQSLLEPIESPSIGVVDAADTNLDGARFALLSLQTSETTSLDPMFACRTGLLSSSEQNASLVALQPRQLHQHCSR